MLSLSLSLSLTRVKTNGPMGVALTGSGTVAHSLEWEWGHGQ